MEKLDKPVMHLTIELECARKTFEDGLIPAINLIEAYGHAISIAKKFKGGWIVTEKGYLMPAFSSMEIDSLPAREGILTIDENFLELHTLGRILEKRNIDSIPLIHFHFKDDHSIEEIGFNKGKRLYYLKTIKEEYSINEARGLINKRSA
jgi:hypothetical protein